MRHVRGGAFVAVIAAILLVAAACGGDSSDEGSATTAAAPADTAAAAPADTGAAEAGGGSGGTLVGTVGPGFTITLTQDGQPVTSLAPGEYTFQIDDQADVHNFHLTGPGVDEATEVSETGMTTWTVTLEAGTYDYVCDPHASQMNGSFTVS